MLNSLVCTCIHKCTKKLDEKKICTTCHMLLPENCTTFVLFSFETVAVIELLCVFPKTKKTVPLIILQHHCYFFSKNINTYTYTVHATGWNWKNKVFVSLSVSPEQSFSPTKGLSVIQSVYWKVFLFTLLIGCSVY